MKLFIVMYRYKTLSTVDETVKMLLLKTIWGFSGCGDFYRGLLNVTLCNLQSGYHHFGGTRCLISRSEDGGGQPLTIPQLNACSVL
jgi:hypothetical protein